MRNAVTGYAIIRVYLPLDRDIDSCISVTKVLATQEQAEAEVTRLNELRRQREGEEVEYLYLWQYTRLSPDLVVARTGLVEPILMAIATAILATGLGALFLML